MTIYIVVDREQDYGGQIFGVYSLKPLALQRLEQIRTSKIEAELEEYDLDNDFIQSWERMSVE